MKAPFLILSLAGLSLFTTSCGWNWNKLNPTYIEPVLVNNNEPVLRKLDDGRDLSGYDIPKNSYLNRYDRNSEPGTTYTSKGSNSEESIPYGTKTDNAHEVISPYPPYKKLDATGHSSGTIVRDPATLKKFRLP